MHPIRRLEPSFVEHLPEVLEPGKLYVSIDFASTAHLCCCGCQSEIVAPLSPTDWKLTYDGVNVSLHPSIGNWSLPCRSHYVIKHGKVRWAGDWSEEQVAKGRRQDRASKKRYYGEEVQSKSHEDLESSQERQTAKRENSILVRILAWIHSWR